MPKIRPTISVIIPTYNRLALLKETLNSVLQQTIPVHEIIVIDDASTDGTPDAVRQYGPPVVLSTQEHAMEAAARNRGAAMATGEWIALLDSDDIWKPTKIERQIQYIDQHPECGLVHTGYDLLGTTDCAPRYPRFLKGEHTVEHLLFGEDWICISTVLFRREIPIPFREWAWGCSDILFYGDLIGAGVRLGYLDEPLVGYRVHDESLNRISNSQCKGASSQWRWVTETFSADPSEQKRLYRNMLTKGVDRMAQAKSRRQWSLYWEWREWLQEHWLAGEPQPQALSERIYPPLAYRLRDAQYRILRRIKSGRLKARTNESRQL
jgi:glycosyltransferase involved in cell wall biosynthesis